MAIHLLGTVVFCKSNVLVPDCNKSYELTLVVKNGVNGAFGWDGMEILHQPAFLNENVVDCIGAGDSFNAGFLHKFTSGASLAECMEYGALIGAVSTTKAGGVGAFLNREITRELAAKLFNKII